jgi:tetratricopeptide (TPR) repeat protein
MKNNDRTENVRKETEAFAPLSWTAREAYLLAAVCLLMGIVVGYVFRGSSPAAPNVAAAASTAAGAPPAAGNQAPSHSPEAVKLMAEPLLAALKVDPRNFKTLVDLGNLYYDNHVYNDAIGYYTRALEVKPEDYNVRTDLGTSHWYSGQPQKAIVEYERALKYKPDFGATLMNLGVVRMEGLKDARGAIAAWEQLLKANPDYPDKARVLEMISRAKDQKS